jgi:hypothetical protein
MKRQRGFTDGWAYLFIVALILSGLTGLYRFGYSQGVKAVYPQGGLRGQA